MKHKTDEKGRGGYRVLKGSRTTINGSKSSVYRGLGRKGNEKRRGRLWKCKYMNCRWQQDSYSYEKIPENTVFIRADDN